MVFRSLNIHDSQCQHPLFQRKLNIIWAISRSMDNLDQEEQAASLLSSPSTISLSEKQIVESRPRTILARWRLALEIVMACLILALTYNSTLIGKRDKSSPVPNCMSSLLCSLMVPNRHSPKERIHFRAGSSVCA